LTAFQKLLSFNNSVAYLQSWLKVLKNDPRMIVSAASKAEKAVVYILYGTKEAA
jgi:antirestriction protein ArdC